jgi:hypothetical protein
MNLAHFESSKFYGKLRRWALRKYYRTDRKKTGAST